MRCAFLSVILLGTFARAQVPAGTPIKLMVLKNIGSSSSYPGDSVPLVVTADVWVGGKLAIPEGTMTFGHVTWTRREGALSATLFDKPARLQIHLEHLRDFDGHEVILCPKPKQTGDLQITRDMIVSPTNGENQEFSLAWKDPNARPAMLNVQDLFSNAASSLSQQEAEVLVQHNVAVPALQQAIRDGLFGEVMNLVRLAKSGRVLEAVLSIVPVTRPALVAVRAVRELGRLSGGIGSYVGGRFKGRNIECSSGAELTVYAGP